MCWFGSSHFSCVCDTGFSTRPDLFSTYSNPVCGVANDWDVVNGYVYARGR